MTTPATPPRSGGRHVFLIGAARSGTKLLRDLVATHPRAAAVPYDVNYVWRFGNESLPHDELVPEHLTEAARARIAGYLERYRRGGDLLVEKTVSNSLRVPYVHAVFPDARFIHLIRDPVDVVESVWRQWQAPPRWGYLLRKASTFPFVEAFGYARDYAARVIGGNLGRSKPLKTWGPRYREIDEDLSQRDLLEVCAIQTARCSTEAAEGLGALGPGRVFRIHYEDFVRDPSVRLRDLWKFVELDPGAIDAGPLCRKVTVASVGRGWRDLDRRQKSVVLARVEEVRHALGYSPERADRRRTGDESARGRAASRSDSVSS